MHLKQAEMHARVQASGDEGLDLQTFPGDGVLVVPIATVWSAASSVPKGGSGLIPWPLRKVHAQPRRS